MKKRRKLKKSVKIVLSIIVIAVIVWLLVRSTSFSYKEKEYREIYVSNRDTLWEIAKLEKNNNEYYKNKDIREIVFDIKKVNNLQSSDIYEHQKLLIPKF